MTKRIAIVGTGPSALAAFWGLNHLSNLEITILDTGINDKNYKDFPVDADAHDFKTKLGQDYIYRRFSETPRILLKELRLPTSFAYGGLSNVWGATMLPFSSFDLTSWPVFMQDLDQFYSRVASNMPISQHKWKNSGFYKSYANREGMYLSKNITQILEKGLDFLGETELSPMPLAVQTSNFFDKGCTYCNQCLRGCPFDYIWRSTHAFDSILNLKNVQHISGARVLSVSKSSAKLVIEYQDSRGEIRTIENFDHIFLGTGPIESFRITSTSGLTEKKASSKDSNTFLIPFVNLARQSEGYSAGYSLSQAYLRCNSNAGNLIHTQFYVYSEALLDKAISDTSFLKLFPRKVLRFFLRRMMFGIAYVSSSDSVGLDFELGPEGEVHVSPSLNPKINLRSLSHKNQILNFGVVRHLSLIPLTPLIRRLDPGAGAHFGCWAPAGSKTDSLGRLNPDWNLHIIDSSVLPTIPPGPLTFSVMANACRIASQATL
jgi:ferredoxin